jgi:membrane-associated phospholipid phosphatase
LLLPAALTAFPPAAPAAEDFPYELNPGQEVVLSASGAVLLTLGMVMMGNQSGLTPEEVAALDRNDVNPLDRPATYNWSTASADVSDILQVIQVAAPVALAVGGKGRQRAAAILVMYAETLLLVNGFAQVAKGAFQRTRPYPYNEDPDISDELRLEVDATRSFPSGHTINAFNSAVFLGSVYGKLYPESPARTWVWVGGLTVAASTGVLRYTAGKHFPTDILTGALVGSTVGFAVPKVHEIDRVQLGLYPSDAGPGLSLTYRF